MGEERRRDRNGERVERFLYSFVLLHDFGEGTVEFSDEDETK
jgi:hypothetical protein